MRAWFVGIVALSLALVGVTGTVADTQEEEDGYLIVGMDSDGEIHVEEVAENPLDHNQECTWDPVMSTCSTGSHAGGSYMIHGFVLPTGTTVGDFQSNLIGDNGNTAQFHCSFSYNEGSAIQGTPGYDCTSTSSNFPTAGFTHDCYAYPYEAIGNVPGTADPASPGTDAGTGIPGWINQPEDSTVCFADDYDFF